MLPDRVSNPGPLIYESGAVPIALRGPNIYILYLGRKSIAFKIINKRIGVNYRMCN